MILKTDVSTSFTGLPQGWHKTKIQYGGSLFAGRNVGFKNHF